MQKSFFLQKMPGGLCFAHGPYTADNCPQWPKCVTDPQKPEYIHRALEEMQRQQEKNKQPASTPTPPSPRQDAEKEKLWSAAQKLFRAIGKACDSAEEHDDHDDNRVIAVIAAALSEERKRSLEQAANIADKQVVSSGMNDDADGVARGIAHAIRRLIAEDSDA